MQEWFETEGYNIVTGYDGEECIAQEKKEQPDLIIIDINMPKMNGFEVLIALKKQFGDNPIPKFIFLSARIQPKDSEYGLELGADAYITKPFETTELLNSIENCLLKS